MVVSSFAFIITTSTSDKECVWHRERGIERENRHRERERGHHLVAAH